MTLLKGLIDENRYKSDKSCKLVSCDSFFTGESWPKAAVTDHQCEFIAVVGRVAIQFKFTSLEMD